MTDRSRLAACAVGDSRQPPVDRPLDDAVDWFHSVSLGAWRPEPIALAAITLGHGLGRYRAMGGIGASGPTTQDLAAEAIACLDEASRTALGHTGGKLLLLVPGGFHPHAWRPRRGGIALGGGAWCQRFAVVPATAPLGTVAHELAHLLLDWRDGDRAGPGAEDCLMSLGGLRKGGNDPAPPSAPLLLAEGWRRPVRLDARVTASDLATIPGGVGCLDWRGGKVVVELRSDRLLAWAGDPARPSLIANLPKAGREALPVLGLLGPALRRLPEIPSGAPAVEHQA